MQFPRCLPRKLAIISVLASSSFINAHTWVENVRLVASNGTFVGEPGYTRGWIPRGASDYNDFNLQNHIPPDGLPTGNLILPTEAMCRPSQSQANQTEGYPTLTAAPGDQVAITYLENGHVTKLSAGPGKPSGSGTVFIYGTKNPSPSDTYLGIHRVWNADGTGGDKRGKLLATRPFDDGRCFQISDQTLSQQRQAAMNLHSELPCQADFEVPADAGTSGYYTVYWVWEWPTLFTNGAIQTNQSYTSCMDISLTSKPLANVGTFVEAQVSGNNALGAAIPAYLNGTQFSVDPNACPQIAANNMPTGSAPPGVNPPSSCAFPPTSNSHSNTGASTGSNLNSTSSTSSSSSTSSKSSSSPTSLVPGPSATAKANGGFVTVTVTQAMSTVTVTATQLVPIAGSQTASKPAVLSTSTATSIPVPRSSSSSSPATKPTTSSTPSAVSAPAQASVAAAVGGKPVVTPFLKRSAILRGRAFKI